MDFRNAAEIELRIALLPPISRGAHLAGPHLHAERLVALWKADAPVTLGEAFRLLGVEAVAEVILQASVECDGGDPRHWQFPPFAVLLALLRAQVWEEMLAGKITLEAIKGFRGRRHQPLAPTLLPRLAPDWELGRLTRAVQDEYIDVRARPALVSAIPRPWQQKPSNAEVGNVVADVAKAFSSANPPSFDEFWALVKDRLPGTTLHQMRKALREQAPHLRRARGQATKMKSSG